MKNITYISLIYILSTLLSGCTFQPSLYEKVFYNIDLSKYQQEDLFVSIGDFYQEYKPLSILTVACYDGYIKKETAKPISSENKKYNDDVYYSLSQTYRIKDYYYKDCYIDDLLDFLFKSAKELNANGIIKLEIKTITQKSPINGQIQDGLLITGLAIKK